VHEQQIALVMMLDIAVLTGLLYFTGGPHNPFAFLYVVQIALATVLVRALWSWMLVGLSFVGFGILLVAHQPLRIPDDSRVIGMWVALGVASAFVVHFLRRITGALSERDEELTEARHLAARQERLASLATTRFAAHELSTPLGTAARREGARACAPGDRRRRAADSRAGGLPRDPRQMAQGAGTVGKSHRARSASFDEIVGSRDSPVVREFLRVASAIRVPPRAVSQALRSLVTNAQDASPPTAAVVTARRANGSRS
jgi:two-component system sensor histidine kinase RegB